MAHILIHIVQIIGILVPFIGCVSLLRRVQSRTSIYLLLANLGCLIINGSYLLLLQTETYDGALTALKMEYFGNVIFYLMFAMFLWSYLKIKGHIWVKVLFVFWVLQDITFLLCIWSGDRMQNVFTSLEFQWDERARRAGAQFVICISLILMLLCNFSFEIVPV